MVRFEDPWLLVLIVIVPLMIFYQLKGLKVPHVKFSSLDTLRNLKKSSSLFMRHLLLGLRCLGVTLLILALARPQSGAKIREDLTEGIDIMLCVDTSKSMRAVDMQMRAGDSFEKFPHERDNRLEVVKRIAADFIRGRTYDRIGIVVFGEDAFTQCPLTCDHGLLLNFLEQLEVGMAGESTAIGFALAISVKRLKKSTAKSKVVVLLTDGQNNAGSITPRNAADIANIFNIKTYAIGIGTRGKAPYPVDTFYGPRHTYQYMDVDEDTLREVAAITRGTYFRATNDLSLKDIFSEIDLLEKTEIKVREYMEFEELFHWFLIAGLICIVIEILLTNTRFKRLP